MVHLMKGHLKQVIQIVLFDSWTPISISVNLMYVPSSEGTVLNVYCCNGNYSKSDHFHFAVIQRAVSIYIQYHV